MIILERKNGPPTGAFVGDSSRPSNRLERWPRLPAGKAAEVDAKAEPEAD